jgi:PEP-CTERM motif
VDADGGGGGSFLSSLATDPIMVGGENSGDGSVSMTPPTATVPEPATWAMMLIGLAGLGFAGLRQKRRGYLGWSLIRPR